MRRSARPSTVQVRFVTIGRISVANHRRRLVNGPESEAGRDGASGLGSYPVSIVGVDWGSARLWYASLLLSNAAKDQNVHVSPGMELRSYMVACLIPIAFSPAALGSGGGADNETRMAQLLARAAGGSADDARRVGDAYLTGQGMARSDSDAVYWYQKAAHAGDPAAQNQLGYCYGTGIGVPSDQVQAVRWYQLAVGNGSAAAKVNLGVAYLRGFGVAEDAGLAADLFRQAAGDGVARGAAYLGDLYYVGHGVPLDQKTAEHWYTVGARLHDAVAEYDLGMLLTATEDRRPKGAAWLRKSVAGGYVPAMHFLGLLLVNHPGMPQSDTEAASLLRAASRAGEWQSSAALGAMERDGRKTALDRRAAYYDFFLAATQGGDHAQHVVAEDLRILRAELGPEQAQVVETEVKSWYTLHPEVIKFLVRDENSSKIREFDHAIPE
jgi:uncharacterized protein